MGVEGLTSKEVHDRIKKGYVNGNFSVKTKSVKQIILNNSLTLFNLINLFLALCLIFVQSYKNIMFLGVVFWNFFIGIVQEIRSKRIVDKLSLLSTPEVMALRDGKIVQINIKDIVMDEVILLYTGNQISVDSLILEGNCEVNESFLTGESEPVYKKKGDRLLSGSYIIAGNVKTQAVHIGKENYVNKITQSAKYLKKPNSEILSAIKIIIKIVTIGLIPITILLFLNQIGEMDFDKSVVGTVAAVIGMIPSGLVLLTSMVLAVSVIRLGKKDTLVQELYCIETLSRVNVLCLDKTGTITKGTMKVCELINCSEETKEDIGAAIYSFTININDNNPTYKAIEEFGKYYEEEYKKINIKYGRPVKVVPFSSEKKYSSVEFLHDGTYILGAYEYIIKNRDPFIEDIINRYNDIGLRTLVFCHSDNKTNENGLPEDIKVLGILAVSDEIRDEAEEVFGFFRRQGVEIKVISGDNPKTVSYIAQKAGIEKSEDYVDLTDYTDEMVRSAVEKYTIFGRVSPKQKLIIIKKLKEAGNIVAMTGDGANDVMALKEADCSIAMESGSDAARNVSQIVLMNSDFSSMPSIVNEGRRTINNIQRSAALYLTKTIYSSLLAVLFILLPLSYPYIPIQLTLIGACSIGIPSFVLALEPNNNIIKGRFIINVLKTAIPGGLLVLTNVILSQIYGHLFLISSAGISTISFYGLAIAALIQLVKISRPLNHIRKIMCILLTGIFIVAVIFFKEIFDLINLKIIDNIFVIGMFLISIVLYRTYSVLIGKILGNPPNVYTLYTFIENKKSVVLVEDYVENKDFELMLNNLMKNKYLRVDKIGFIHETFNKNEIKIIAPYDNDVFDIVCAGARYYNKKNKTGNMEQEIIVECNEEKYRAILNRKKHYVEIVDENIKKNIRMLKKIKVTF